MDHGDAPSEASFFALKRRFAGIGEILSGYLLQIKDRIS